MYYRDPTEVRLLKALQRAADALAKERSTSTVDLRRYREAALRYQVCYELLCQYRSGQSKYHKLASS